MRPSAPTSERPLDGEHHVARVAVHAGAAGVGNTLPITGVEQVVDVDPAVPVFVEAVTGHQADNAVGVLVGSAVADAVEGSGVSGALLINPNE